MSKNDGIDELIGHVFDDPEKAKAEIAEMERKSAVVDALVFQRNHCRLSQRELAAKAGLSPSKVQRMEAGTDDNLNIGDLRAYLRALGVEIEFVLEDTSQPVAKRIRQTVGHIGKLLDELQELAMRNATDEIMLDGIRRFRSEVLLNLLLRYTNSELPEIGKIGADGGGAAAPQPKRGGRTRQEGKRAVAAAMA